MGWKILSWQEVHSRYFASCPTATKEWKAQGEGVRSHVLDCLVFSPWQGLSAQGTLLCIHKLRGKSMGFAAAW